MFKHLLPALFLLASPVCAGPESQQLGEKLADVTGAEKSLRDNFMATIGNATAQMKNGDPALLAAMKDLAERFYDEHYKWDQLRPLFGKSNAAEFTDEEMREAIAFYETPTGKKLASKLAASNRLASQQVAEQVRDKMPKLQSGLMQLVQKHMEAKGAASGQPR